MRSSKMEEAPSLSSIDHSPAISLPSVGVSTEGARGCPRAPSFSYLLSLSLSLSVGNHADFKRGASLGKVR